MQIRSMSVLYAHILNKSQFKKHDYIDEKLGFK